MGPKYSEFNFNGGSIFCTIEEASKYWNGKVVCVEPGCTYLTKGKVYSVENGVLLDDRGNYVGKRPAETFLQLITDLKNYTILIEYKGMA